MKLAYLCSEKIGLENSKLKQKGCMLKHTKESCWSIKRAVTKRLLKHRRAAVTNRLLKHIKRTGKAQTQDFITTLNQALYL